MDKQSIVKLKIAIVGGGASGLFLATALRAESGKIALLERGDRLGRKLSATGNGQGNITHRAVATTPYFSSCEGDKARIQALVSQYDNASLFAFFHRLGIPLFYDGRGRAYPTGRQASALTDALRFYAAERGVAAYTNTQIVEMQKRGETFVLIAANGARFEAEKVVLCTGGKAAKNFGTDGSAYALAQAFGHTLTPLYPSLVQLKTDRTHIKTLKGIRLFDCAVTAIWQTATGERTHTVSGDILFTEYGVSGDAVFRLSAFLADQRNASLSIDFLPDVDKETLADLLTRKRQSFAHRDDMELLSGIVNNQLGRAIVKRAKEGDIAALVDGIKGFVLPVQGTLGFDYAQVTKGGIPLDEVDERLQSKKVKGLYFAGEILDADGECGGFNLQWAFASANAVAAALNAEEEK